MPHIHRYEVMASSTFGVKDIHAVLVCHGIVDGKLCQHLITKVLAYTECEKVEKGKAGRVTYFWTDKEKSNAI